MWASLYRLLALTQQHSGKMALGIFLTAASATMTWFSPKTIAYFIEEGIRPQNWASAKFWIVALALSEILRLASQAANLNVFASIAVQVMADLRSKLNVHLHQVPVSVFDRIPAGRIMTRVAFDVGSISDFYQSGFVSIVGNVATICATWFGIFQISSRIGAYLFLVFIPMVIACVYFSKRLRFCYEESRNQLSALNAQFADFLNGMKTIRGLGLQRSKYQILSDGANRYGRVQFGISQTFAFMHPTISLAIGIMMLIVVWFGAEEYKVQQLTLGNWTALLAYVSLLFNPLVETSDRWNFIIQGTTAMDRVQDLLNEKSEKNGNGVTDEFEKLSLEDVSFAYQKSGKQSVLHKFNMQVKKGEWVGIHGPSGSGKTTLLQLILGFELPDLGVVRWNDQSYVDLDRRTLRGKIGLVEQFPILFAGTIEENITCFGHVHVNWEALTELIQGCPLAQSIILERDKKIGEKGANLSLGQRQMISFLRALSIRPQLWILDEATAFFDLEAEKECFLVLNRLRDSKITVIQVAHRASALVHMDRTIAMTATM